MRAECANFAVAPVADTYDVLSYKRNYNFKVAGTEASSDKYVDALIEDAVVGETKCASIPLAR